MLVVNNTVAIPLPSVVLVELAKDPFVPVLLQVITLPGILTGLPYASASWAVMVTAVPATGLLLFEVTIYFDAAPAVILNAVLTTVPAEVDTVFPVPVNVYPVPALSIARSLKSACPVTVFTATIFVPLKIPPGPALF